MNTSSLSDEHIFIGAAWPYANGPLHLGTLAGCLLPADIFGRYQRMAGRQVLMVSGSDEHGTPITLTADKEGLPPKEIADRFNAQHVKTIEQLGIQFEIYTRTSGTYHQEVVQNFFQRLMDKGYIYKKNMVASYCEDCQRFLPDRYVEGICPYCNGEARGDQCDNCGKILEAAELENPRCKICGASPVMKETEHFFFQLSAFGDKLLEWLEDKDDWKDNVIKFTRNWINQGLQDRAITRDLEWGVPVPVDGYEHKRLYVWFEAVIGYLSASKQWAERTGNKDAWKDWWQHLDTSHLYFLAKDNIPFHTIIWPAMLMAHGDLHLPTNIPANEYLTFSGEQFSKSRGIGVWLPDVLQRFEPDAIRYYLSMNMPEKHDTDWNWGDFVAKINNELVGNFGNFIHRVVSFTHKNFENIPPLGEITDADLTVMRTIDNTVQVVASAIESCHFKEGLKHIFKLSQIGNQYLNEQAPWSLIKNDKNRCATVLHVCLQMVKTLAIIVTPYMPHAAHQIWEMLNQEGRVDHQMWHASTGDALTGKLTKVTPLFTKLDINEILKVEVLPDEKCANHASAAMLNLRVAEIIKVRKHPDAHKLYVLDLDVGSFGKRRIVAGIRPWYAEEMLRGRRVVLIANLKPATIRGVRSQGMLLAADDGTPALLTTSGKPGEQVVFKGIEPQPVDSVTLKLLNDLDIQVNTEGHIVCNGHEMHDISSPIIPDRKVIATTPVR